MSRCLQLQEVLEWFTSSLPLGWRQRLALACALLHEPEIVFLDEPTSGVDPLSRRNFWRIIKELAEEGKTIIVTTHYLEEAEYCDRLAVMHEGRIAALDTPEALRERYRKASLQEVFITILKEIGG